MYVRILFMYVRVCMSAVCTVPTVHTKANPRFSAGYQSTINSARRSLFAEVSQRCHSDKSWISVNSKIMVGAVC